MWHNFNDSSFSTRFVAQVARILSEGSRYVASRHSDRVHHTSARETSPNLPSLATAAETAATGKSAAAVGGINDENNDTSFSAASGSAAAARDTDDVKTLPFEVFLRACNLYFCFQVCLKLLCGQEP